MQGFQFKPGDIVGLKVQAHKQEPARFMVLELLAQECPGGLQRHYQLRTFEPLRDGGYREGQMRVLDMEVVAYPDTRAVDLIRSFDDIKDSLIDEQNFELAADWRKLKDMLMDVWAKTKACKEVVVKVKKGK